MAYHLEQAITTKRLPLKFDKKFSGYGFFTWIKQCKIFQTVSHGSALKQLELRVLHN